MKILHTSDWHVGKVLKGWDRYDEHAAVLADIVRVARVEDVDLVLVAGDLFDSAAPSPKAQGLVMRTLLALGTDGRQVVAIAGDHDSPGLLEGVYRVALGQAGVQVIGTPKRPRRGGLVTLRVRSGETVNVAAMPFLSHRNAARAAEALPPELAGHAVDYPSQIAGMLRILTQGFAPDAVNVVMTHATLVGGRRGGERDAQTSRGYELPPAMFPPSAQYAALGHMHEQQEIPGPCPIFYSGSPMAVDFEDIQNVSSVLIISAEPGKPANTKAVPVTGARSLQTLHGTLDEVITAGEQTGDAYLRVLLAEPSRPGLGDLVRDKLPNALEVVLDEARQPRSEARSTRRVSRIGRNPLEVFGDYLAEQNIVDPRLNEMFAALFEEVTAGSGEKADSAAEFPAEVTEAAGAESTDAGLPDEASDESSRTTAEADSAEQVTGEASDNTELPGDEDGDDQWEYLDAAGPPAADPAAPSATPWDETVADLRAAVTPSEELNTISSPADQPTVLTAIPWAGPGAADLAPNPTVKAAAAASEDPDDGPADVGPTTAVILREA